MDAGGMEDRRDPVLVAVEYRDYTHLPRADLRRRTKFQELGRRGENRAHGVAVVRELMKKMLAGRNPVFHSGPGPPLPLGSVHHQN